MSFPTWILVICTGIVLSGFCVVIRTLDKINDRLSDINYHLQKIREHLEDQLKD